MLGLDAASRGFWPASWFLAGRPAGFQPVSTPCPQGGSGGATLPVSCRFWCMRVRGEGAGWQGVHACARIVCVLAHDMWEPPRPFNLVGLPATCLMGAGRNGGWQTRL